MHVLVVDDQPAVRDALQTLLELEGFSWLCASTPQQALQCVRDEDVGVVVADMNYSRGVTSGLEGVELFRALRALDPELPIILLTAWTSLETAVQLVKEGAFDYLQKPWDDAKLAIAVGNALRLRHTAQENRRLAAGDRQAKAELSARYDLRGLVYESRPMQDLVSLAVRVAQSDVPVLITGPNGCGKERIAEIVQANSRRRSGPFVRVNAGGLPDELLEAELFGAEPGAFTGATKARVGRFEEAHGGTLFLDELGNLSPAGQTKLLRVLQTGEFQRLGSNRVRHSDARIISATNADLRSEIAAGRFREDLLYRLNVIELAIAPLCQRTADIVPLAKFFLERLTGSPWTLSPAAVGALQAYEWPGNVRELQNRLQRAVLVASEDCHELGPADLGLDAGVESSSMQAPLDAPAQQTAVGQGTLASAERDAIAAALERAQGVISRAAAELGVSRQALYRRMERLGLPAHSEKKN